MLAFPWVKYLHVLLSFVFVAALFASHWNTLAARRTTDWAARASFFELNRRIGGMFGLASLLALGILGNMLAREMGFSMKTTAVFRVVNGLWLALVAMALVVDLPASAKLAVLARTAANGTNSGEPVEWTATLSRWRLGNAAQLALFAALLYFMVSPWS